MVIHLLFSGPIRPNIECVKFTVNNYKKQLKDYDIITYLSTWNNNIDTYETLCKIFDYVVINEEPTNEYIYKNLTEKTIQQRQLQYTETPIDDWTLGIYKQFTGIRYLIDYIDNNNLIKQEDIALRIRLDSIIEINDWNLLFNKIREDIINNDKKYYVNFTKGCANYSDWFGVSSYENIRKIWYYKNINYLNIIVKHSFCAEIIVYNMAKSNNIDSINLKDILSVNPNNYLIRKYIVEKHYYE